MFPTDAADIYRRHFAMVSGRALRLLGCRDAANDVVQETFLKTFAWLRKGQRAEDTAAVLYRTVTNLALNQLRDARRRARLLAQSAPPPPTSEPWEDRLALRRVLGLVKEEEALVAAYHYFDGLDQGEIASLLSLHPRAVSRRLQSFQAHARALLYPLEAPNGR